jgi:hypothetical protein
LKDRTELEFIVSTLDQTRDGVSSIRLGLFAMLVQYRYGKHDPVHLVAAQINQFYISIIMAKDDCNLMKEL